MGMPSLPTQPTIQRIIPAQGPIRGGIEVTLLGTNFKPGLNVKFGASLSLCSHVWSESSIVSYLPPAVQAGPVLVTLVDSTTDENGNGDNNNNNGGGSDGNVNGVDAGGVVGTHQIFTYTDDSDRQLIELALQIVGLKMNGKLEDAKNIAKRIIGNTSNNNNNNSNGNSTTASAGGGATDQLQQHYHALQQELHDTSSAWLTQPTSTNTKEQTLLSFLSCLQLPHCPITTPNWSLTTPEGQTMLHLAALKGYSKLTLFLLLNGCKVEFFDSNGFTPLLFALWCGEREVVEVLVKFGAKLHSRFVGVGGSKVRVEDCCDANVLDLIDLCFGGAGVESGLGAGVGGNETVTGVGEKVGERVNDVQRRPSSDSFESMYDDDVNDSLTVAVAASTGVGVGASAVGGVASGTAGVFSQFIHGSHQSSHVRSSHHHHAHHSHHSHPHRGQQHGSNANMDEAIEFEDDVEEEAMLDTEVATSPVFSPFSSAVDSVDEDNHNNEDNC
ncbi:unnamed protein product [Ambrosiozyma monospora]|uniref:Unnamed protein product n=1 Tax=Ambrosiozyma monospora TaxID=43982 RepID=A0ACB5TCC3_AMBMO|nr:unnamed protein product [Ambrosiozyma monospora]